MRELSCVCSKVLQARTLLFHVLSDTASLSTCLKTFLPRH